jgi:sugar lactone lactonase YvrE
VSNHSTSLMRTLSLLLLSATVAAAQDMPLHEILRPGEDWKAVAGPRSLATAVPPYVVDPGKRVVKQGDREFPLNVAEPTCCVVALGGSTLLVGDAAGRYVWAFRIEKDGSIGPGDRYCRLRVPQDDRLKKKDSPVENSRSETSALTVDGAGRFYAATRLGIQVFDPTGRLCGVMTAPPGKVTELTFAGDLLYARAGDAMFVRRMLAEGKK